MGSIQFSYLMGLVQCYALLGIGSGRFFWSLLSIMIDMIQHGIVYAWAPTLLGHIYRELFFYSQGHRTSLSVTITFWAWAYEHIIVAHPSGLPMVGFGSHIEYEVGIIQWQDDFYVSPLDGVRWDVAYYHHILTQLVLDKVTFSPYYSYPIWVELVGELTSVW